jgi:membrane protein DedA with SNARE-associated domain
MGNSASLIAHIQALSYTGIFFMAIIANVVVPVPEEIVLIIFGYISRGEAFNLVILLPLITVGILIGDCAMYFLAYRSNRLVTTFYNHSFAHIIESRGDDWVRRHIRKIIFFSRFMIQFRFIGPFLAGYKKISFKDFFLYDFLAVVIYVPIYVLIGRFFHKKINLIIDNVNSVKNIVVLCIIGFIIFGLTKILYVTLFVPKKK